MRTKLIELTAERRCWVRNASSANIALTRAWQSSNVPSMARLWMFCDPTVVIWRRCTSEILPRGCNTTASIDGRSRNASIAAEPVSPEVATTTVTRSPRRDRTVSRGSPQESHCVVLERQRRAPEEFEHMEIGQLGDGSDVRMTEIGVGVDGDLGQFLGGHRRADERIRHDRRHRGIRSTSQHGEVGRRQLRPLFR